MAGIGENLNSLPLTKITDYVITNGDEIDQARLQAIKKRYDDNTNYLREDNKAMILSDLLKLENDFKKSVEIMAHEQRIASGSQLTKGSVAQEKLKKIKKQKQLKFDEYLEEFKSHDPIARNHNGVTYVTVYDGPPEQQNIDTFIRYSMIELPDTRARDDALTHIKNRKNVFLKYSMPKASFHFDENGVEQYGPSFSRNNFNSDGSINTEIVISGGIDYKNLKAMALNTRKKKKLSLSGYSYSPDFEKLKTQFSFPNFLLGEMLHKVTGVEEVKATDQQVYRPLADRGTDDEAELVVKIFLVDGTSTIDFPYDKDKYFLPDGWTMVERADGVIMYFYKDKGLFQSDFPEGSYIIIPLDKKVSDVLILGGTTFLEIRKKVVEAVNLYESGVGTIDIKNPTIQLHFGLIAYMVNLKNVFEDNPSFTDGGNKQKKYKRTNIKYMKRTKRTKRTKRMKRMNMKYMKKSKKNHHK
jgi:hypothetical protein